MEQERKLLFDEVSPFKDGRYYELGGWRELSEIFSDEHQIRGFFGDYRPLSNFKKARVLLDGIAYDSVEKAYQAAKWLPEDREYFTSCDNRQSIAYNRDNSPNMYTANEWDAVKLDVMYDLLVQKFDPTLNADNAAFLLATGNRYIEETNWWNDTFWGKNLQGEGDNNLGKILMFIRDELLPENL